MSETSTAQIKSRALTVGWWDRLARTLVFNVLRNLHTGHLTVIEDQQAWEFGDPSARDLRATIIIRQAATYRCFAFGGSVGAGEAYMQAAWDSPSLVSVMRLFAANIDVLNQSESRWPIMRRLAERVLECLHANTIKGARRNIAAHYDLSNDFFRLFLDPSMMYSSAIYQSDDCSLELASLHKLDTVCRKLRLGPQDHLLEIGTGWGGLALHAAKNYGCRVTTTTISKEQYDYALDLIRSEGLQDRVTLLQQDYRQLEGRFDKLVSIEMIEAVGHEYYADYFKTCSGLLKPDGLMVIQAITVADQRYDEARRSVDFIRKYIFPGGSLPSIAVMADCVSRRTDMVITGIEDIGRDYALTLRDWRDRFDRNLPRVQALGFDDVFSRMWEFYLSYCEGGFRERAISTVQVVMAKPAARDI